MLHLNVWFDYRDPFGSSRSKINGSLQQMAPPEMPAKGRRIDPILQPLLSTTDDEEKRRIIERLLSQHAGPIIDTILSRKLRASIGGGLEETSDLRNDVILLLLKPLQNMSSTSDQEPIESFRDYVASLTYYTFNNYLRRKYPERTRLRNRIKYLLTHSAQFALWSVGSGASVCGLAKHGRERDASDAEAVLEIRSLPAAAFDANDPARAMTALFRVAGTPLEFESLVSLLARLWNVRDGVEIGDLAAGLRQANQPPARGSGAQEQLENRQFLEKLWIEICELRPRQRTALLLSLRDATGQSALPLFPALGIAGIRRIAEVVALDPDTVAAFWNDLPFDDLRIAALLGVSRQQVINLRKSARERLARRMKR